MTLGPRDNRFYREKGREPFPASVAFRGGIFAGMSLMVALFFATKLVSGVSELCL